MFNRSKTALGLLAPVLLIVSACGENDAAQAQSRGAQTAPVREQLGPVPMTLDTATAARLSGAFRGAADRALPAVVQIRVTVQQQRAVNSSQRRSQTPFPFPFPGIPDGNDPAPPGQGTGSGFIFDNRGYILTNNHVVEGATSVHITMVDGREYDAKIVGTDENTDLAVIKIEPRRNEKFAAAQIGSSDQLRVGDWVLALGNPLGLDFTVTAGIVSAKSRSINIIESPYALESFIQTDAAINRGNSGGPLVDLLGRVVGINSAIQSPTGYYTGAGFAIPIDLARKVAQDLMEFGAVHRPRLGVEVQPITEADAEIYKLSEVAGAEIVSVDQSMPAAKAGLQMGDVVVAVDGKAIRTQADFMLELAKKRPGDQVGLDYIRYGKREHATVKLGQFVANEPQRARPERPLETSSRLGFRVATAGQQLAARCQLNRAGGVFIAEVEPYGPVAGFQFGQCTEVLKINGQAINSAQDVDRVARGLKGGDVVSLVVRATDQNGESVERIINYRLNR